jgi:hypothetical protein
MLLIQICLIGITILAGLLVLGYIGEIAFCAAKVTPPIEDWVYYWEQGVIICCIVFLLGVVCMLFRI